MIIMINFQTNFRDSKPDLYLLPNFSATKAKCKFRIELVTQASDRRKEVEAFISNSYAINFQANLKSFFPIIITVIQKSNNKIVSALGLRYADSEELFSESYLDKPIETLIRDKDNCFVNRKSIVELGNFAVGERDDVKKVLPTIARFIKSIKVDYLAYTLTTPIKAYFNFFNLELNHLAKANLSDVNRAADDWGIYYQLKPAVYFTNVSRNKHKI